MPPFLVSQWTQENRIPKALFKTPVEKIKLSYSLAFFFDYHVPVFLDSRMDNRSAHNVMA